METPNTGPPPRWSDRRILDWLSKPPGQDSDDFYAALRSFDTAAHARECVRRVNRQAAGAAGTKHAEAWRLFARRVDALALTFLIDAGESDALERV